LIQLVQVPHQRLLHVDHPELNGAPNIFDLSDVVARGVDHRESWDERR
jgi:hypothetical protein